MAPYTHYPLRTISRAELKRQKRFSQPRWVKALADEKANIAKKVARLEKKSPSKALALESDLLGHLGIIGFDWSFSEELFPGPREIVSWASAGYGFPVIDTLESIVWRCEDDEAFDSIHGRLPETFWENAERLSDTGPDSWSKEQIMANERAFYDDVEDWDEIEKSSDPDESKETVLPGDPALFTWPRWNTDVDALAMVCDGWKPLFQCAGPLSSAAEDSYQLYYRKRGRKFEYYGTGYRHWG
jgi:hypothetical protein